MAFDEAVELPGFGSVPECDTVTVFTMEPVASKATVVPSRNCAEVPVAAGKTARVQVIVPFVPTAGVVHDQPAGTLMS